IRAAMRLTTTMAGVLTLFASIITLPGCANEERGPIRSGGREVKSWITDLQDPDALVRRDAIRAVAKLKQPGGLIKERLQTMSRLDKDSLARDLASKALERLGGTE